jgi:hypothetical protein
MPVLPGEQVIATILKHDNKTTSYKMALLRAINDVVLMYPDVARQGQAVAVPLRLLAEFWIAYYWPFADQQRPIYQGRRAVRGERMSNDMAFRTALTDLRAQWENVAQLTPHPGDGFFLLTEMRTPRRRATYAPALVKAYEKTIADMVAKALSMPIKHAGPGHWSVFDQPAPLKALPSTVIALPGTQPRDTCVVISPSLWEAFHRLSLYVEALCLHEWCLFTETVGQEEGVKIDRGQVYMLLTAHPANRRPLTWERNQVDILLHESVYFSCPWTGIPITQPDHYDLDHLLPVAVYPINELWNLLPVNKQFNQRIKRDRIPDRAMLLACQGRVAAAYATYQQSAKLRVAMHEDAHLRFASLLPMGSGFADSLAHHAVEFIDSVASSRYATRFSI